MNEGLWIIRLWSAGSECGLAGSNVSGLLRWVLTKTAKSHQLLFHHGSYTSPMSVADCCLSPTYRLEDCAGGTKALRPINGGISFSLNICFLIFVADWSAPFWYCGLFFSSVLWKGVGGEWWTLWCWQPAVLFRRCAWHMCENPVVFSLCCQEPIDLP